MTHFLFIPPCLLWTLCWLGCFSLFFFGFVVALVLCVKPAPEQQRLDDAIGFLRDHAEVRTAEFQFFFPPFPPLFIRHPSFPYSFTHVYATMTNAKTCPLHFLLITLLINFDYILWWGLHCAQCIIVACTFLLTKTRLDNQSALNCIKSFN